MCLYDGLRLYWLLPHGRRLRDAEDILYWVYCGLWAFAQAFYEENDGNFDGTFYGRIAIGMILLELYLLRNIEKDAPMGYNEEKGRTGRKGRQSVRDSTKRNRKKKRKSKPKCVAHFFFVVAALLTVLTVYTLAFRRQDAVYASQRCLAK